MSLQAEMAKLRARKARIEQSLARANEYPCPNRAYLSHRIARLVARYYDLEAQAAAPVEAS